MGSSCSKIHSKQHKADQQVKTPPDPRPSKYCSTEPALQSNSNGEKMGVKAFVDGKIKDNKIVVFSKDYCPYCTKAKNALFSILSKDEVDVEEINLRDDTDEIQDYLKELTGGRSVPRVFINQKFIGGGDDTVRMKNSGELQKLLGLQAA